MRIPRFVPLKHPRYLTRRGDRLPTAVRLHSTRQMRRVQQEYARSGPLLRCLFRSLLRSRLQRAIEITGGSAADERTLVTHEQLFRGSSRQQKILLSSQSGHTPARLARDGHAYAAGAMTLPTSGGEMRSICASGLWADTSMQLRQVAKSRLTYSSEKARRWSFSTISAAPVRSISKRRAMSIVRHLCSLSSSKAEVVSRCCGVDHDHPF